MQMKRNKALLLGGTVLFSVMGSVEEANSTEIQNEINIINDEKPVVVTNVVENKASRIDEDINNIEIDNEEKPNNNIGIQKHVEDVLGGGKNIDFPNDGKERVVIRKFEGNEQKIKKVIEFAELDAKHEFQSVNQTNEAIRDLCEGSKQETLALETAYVLDYKEANIYDPKRAIYTDESKKPIINPLLVKKAQQSIDNKPSPTVPSNMILNVQHTVIPETKECETSFDEQPRHEQEFKLEEEEPKNTAPVKIIDKSKASGDNDDDLYCRVETTPTGIETATDIDNPRIIDVQKAPSVWYHRVIPTIKQVATKAWNSLKSACIKVKSFFSWKKKSVNH